MARVISAMCTKPAPLSLSRVCGGQIIEISSKVGTRTEVDHVCETCGSSPDLSPLVIETMSPHTPSRRVFHI